MSNWYLAWMDVAVASWVDWILGLDRVGVSEGRAILGWRYELPLWVWVVVFVGAVTLASWSYAGLIGRGWPKVMLATIRILLLMFLIAILAGPMWVKKREEVEPDWLLMLVDQSASMRIQDANTQKDGTPQLVSRQEAVRELIVRNTELFGSEQLGRDRRLVWFGFDAQVYPIEPFPIGDTKSWISSNGQITLLRTAIEQALQRASGNPVSGIVLFTDGRSPQSTGSDLIRQLGQQAVSVFPVPFGADVPSVDLSLARVESPSKAFVKDPVPVTVWMDRYPIHAPIDLDRFRVQLIDVSTGEVLDEASPGQRAFSDPIHLAGRSQVVGETTWRVVLNYEPRTTQIDEAHDAPVAGELITDNNQQLIHLEFVDQPIRVLYVEGYPRWEYRYLTNALIREKSILSSIMLISADQGFSQEGDVSITRLPQSRQELQAFDVVIIGDVPAEYFSLSQQSQLRDHVAENGAGLLWIGGASHTPYSYDATQLTDLLPMVRPGLVHPAAISDPIVVTTTTQAENLNVLALRDPTVSRKAEEVRRDVWPEDLPGLRWVQAIGPMKPSVEVLAKAFLDDSGTNVPLVVRHRYGSGQILYVATDDTWRWRYGRGDLYFQQFWVQLIRFLGRHQIQENTRQIWLSASHRRIELDHATVVKLHARDAMLRERRLPKISVSVTRENGAQHNLPSSVLEQLELLPEPDQKNAASSSNQATSTYKAIWQPRHTGRIVLTVSEPILRDMDITLPVEVLHPDDEMRQPMPDHERLESLAESSGGKLVLPENLTELATLIPNRARRTPNDIRYPLWDAPLTLIVVIILLTVEWVGRKWFSWRRSN